MKRLTKGHNQMICGVCSGFAEYLGVDPTIVRLAMVLFTALGGAGILVYIIAAIIMPDAER